MPKPSKQYSLNMNAAEWWWFNAVNMWQNPFAIAGGWMFDFPPPPGKAGYIVHAHTVPLKETNVLELFCSVNLSDPPPIFDRNGPVKCAARLILMKQDFVSTNLNDRWWSLDSIPLEESNAHEIRVPLTPNAWHRGAENPSAFRECLANIGRIGLSFGGDADFVDGDTSFGHGVNVELGVARFFCNRLSLL